MSVENFLAVKKRLGAAAQEFGLPPKAAPVLIVVTKNQPVENILPLLEEGHRDFGENRVQEALSKWPDLKAKFPDITLHMIGPLQTNKAKDALGLFDVVHTIDRAGLIDAVLKHAAERHRFFVQVNTGNEPQKAGVSPLEVSDFIDSAKKALGKKLVGLMCIPPATENPAPHFGLLKLFAQQHALKELSMGMSNDYTLAAAMGATYVRVGSAIFK